MPTRRPTGPPTILAARGRGSGKNRQESKRAGERQPRKGRRPLRASRTLSSSMSRSARGVSLVSTDEFPDNSVISAILLSGAPPEGLLCQHLEPGLQCPLTGSPLSVPKVPPLFAISANVKAASANTY
ncbi:unnamed protein product [Rangifer tarandus platyrhynchus]|uniref:Uncharacterized protein n=1 Tax=Rangifer tarandus platyrhynchus TaxID=3082113 RepID=A0AC59ZMZ6_RANTA